MQTTNQVNRRICSGFETQKLRTGYLCLPKMLRTKLYILRVPLNNLSESDCFFDLCRFSIYTFNWILYEPIWNDVAFAFDLTEMNLKSRALQLHKINILFLESIFDNDQQNKA